MIMTTIRTGPKMTATESRTSAVNEASHYQHTVCSFQSFMRHGRFFCECSDQMGAEGNTPGRQEKRRATNALQVYEIGNYSYVVS